MSRYGKLLLQVVRGGADANVRFSDLYALLRHLGFDERIRGCMAHGSTPMEAVANAQEAIALWIDTAKEFGHPVPEPKGRRLMYA